MFRSLKSKKMLKVSFFILGSFLMVLPFVLGQTQLFYEDWEAGNFDDWSNSAWTIETSPAIDTNSAGCLQRLICDMSSTVSVDTSSAGPVNVSFSYYDIGNDAGKIIWYWNNSDGDWVSIGNIDGGTLSGHDDWFTHSAQSNDLQYKHNGFAIRFWADPDNKAFYYLDNINISYGEALPDTCTCPGLNQNWEINMADFCDIESDCDLGTGTLSFTGSGYVNCNAKIETSNMGDPTSSGIFYVKSNCEVYSVS